VALFTEDLLLFNGFFLVIGISPQKQL